MENDEGEKISLASYLFIKSYFTIPIIKAEAMI